MTVSKKFKFYGDLMKKKIIAIGEIIWDIYPDKQVVGGAALNFISHTSLCGAQSTLVSAVGTDELGEKIIEIASDFGVDCRYIKKIDRPTGQCIVTLNENGIPCYDVLENMAYDNISITDDDIANIKADKYDALYFGTLIQRSPTSRKAVRDIVQNCHFSEIICDVNLRTNCYDADSVGFCLENATVLKISIEEEPLLRSFGRYAPISDRVNDIAKALCNSFDNLKIVIITLGKDGSFAYDSRSGKEYTQPAIGDKVVSTVGAGDSFAAAWMTNYLQGQPVDVCIKKGAELSGFVVAHTDAVPRY